MKQIPLRVDDKLHASLKEESHKRGVSLNVLITETMRKLLAGEIEVRLISPKATRKPHKPCRHGLTSCRVCYPGG